MGKPSLHVHGLGLVTHHYFGMPLGYPDTKIDTCIIRAFQSTVNTEHVVLSESAKLAEAVVTEVH